MLEAWDHSCEWLNERCAEAAEALSDNTIFLSSLAITAAVFTVLNYVSAELSQFDIEDRFPSKEKSSSIVPVQSRP